MRLSATILLVACCSASLVGCCNRFHRHSCLFGNRHKHDGCVDQYDWDDDDGDSGCPCDGGPMMHGGPMPMQSIDSGCGCGGGMPQYMDPGMPMSFPSYQPSGCGCSGGGGGGMMMAPPMQSMPTYNNQSMMMQPMPDAVPTPAQPPAAPPASSVPPTTEYYSPRTITPTSSVPAAF